MAPHDCACERAPLPVSGVFSRVASGYESSGRSAREALTCGGALGAHWAGRPPFDGGARCPGLGCVLEEPLTLLSWPKESAH